MSRYYVSREAAPVHVWDREDVTFVEPPSTEDVDPFYEPFEDPLCGRDAEDHETEPMEDHAENLKAFVRGRPDLTCPGCVLALERRHALPESYRTDALEERISEYQAATTERVVPPGSTEADVVDAAREMLEEARRAGWEADDLTLTVDRETHEALREESAAWGPATRKMEVMTDPVTSLDGVPVMEDDETDGMDLATPMDYEAFTVDIEVSTEAVREAAEKMAEDARERIRKAGPMGGLDPSAGAPPTHPSSRSSFTPLADGVVDRVDVSGGLPDDVEDLLGMDVDEMAERARVESGYEGRHPPKYVPDGLDPAPVAGKPPGVAGVTKDADCWCLDCAVQKDWVDFGPEPTQPDVDLILRDSEWDYLPRCGECERPLDVPFLESGYDRSTDTFTGTVVRLDPVVLDDGSEQVCVYPSEPWDDAARLGEEREVPLEAIVPADTEAS